MLLQETDEPVRGQRPREIEALNIIAVHVLKDLNLIFCFRALNHELFADALHHAHRGFQNLPPVCRIDLVQHALVDFDQLKRQMHDPLDAGIADAVIVQREGVAHADQLVDVLQHDLADVLKVRLGDLQIDPGRVDAVLLLQRADLLRQAALHALGDGEVDFDVG